VQPVVRINSPWNNRYWPVPNDGSKVILGVLIWNVLKSDSPGPTPEIPVENGVLLGGNFRLAILPGTVPSGVFFGGDQLLDKKNRKVRKSRGGFGTVECLAASERPAIVEQKVIDVFHCFR